MDERIGEDSKTSPYSYVGAHNITVATTILAANAASYHSDDAPYVIVGFAYYGHSAWKKVVYCKLSLRGALVMF